MAVADQRREAVRQEIKRRGLRCIQQGKAWRVFGNGIDIVTADLEYIRADELVQTEQWDAN